MLLNGAKINILRDSEKGSDEWAEGVAPFIQAGARDPSMTKDIHLST
jgi:hypothetical protein